MTLLDSLRRIDPERIAITTPAASVSYGELIQRADELADRTTGRRIAFATNDLIGAVTLLAAAHGCAHSVVLWSPTVPADVLAEHAAVVRPDIVFAANCERLKPHLGGIELINSAHDIGPTSKDAAAIQETAWILTTSGTTGTPKLVEHSLDGLTRTTRRDTDKGGRQVWGLLYDFTRFAGMQVVLQSLLSGATLIAPDLDAPLSEQLMLLAEKGVTNVSATPTLWRKILMSPAAGELHLRQVTLGGEIADDAILGAVARRFEGARISHIFASTEAGVGFSVRDGKAGFPTEYLSDPPSGIALKIVDGRLHVKNSEVASEYLGGAGQLADDGWVDTGDAVEERDGRVHFLGRESGVINVGGNKVHPETVEHMLLSHPAVAMAKVYAKKNPITGALVVADVVPEGEPDPELKETLMKFLIGQLPQRYMVPAILRITTPFEVTAAGKIKRTDP